MRIRYRSTFVIARSMMPRALVGALLCAALVLALQAGSARSESVQRQNVGGGCYSPLMFGDDPTAGLLRPLVQTDCYRFAGAAGDRVRVRLVGASATLRQRTKIVTPSSDEMDECFATASNNDQTCLLGESGSYTVLVRADTALGSEQYWISTQSLTAPVGCRTLMVGAAQASSSLTIVGEMDCYRFGGSSGDVVRIRVHETPGALVTLTDALRPDGATLPCSPTSDSDFECRLEASGMHTIIVRDLLGTNTGEYTVAFENSAPPPETAIDSGPIGRTNDPTPTFAFSAPEGSSFECRLNSAAFAPCGSPFTTATLADGSHTFAVRAILYGIPDPTPATRAFVVDTIAPDTAIDSGPASPTNDATPTFTLSSEPDAGLECSIDGSAFVSCSSPFTPVDALADGDHTLQVRARDAAGNADPTPASRAFTIDTTPPVVTITTVLAGPTTDPTPTFEFSGDPGASFECSVDGGQFVPCVSPFTVSALAPGEHTFAVRATDLAGNTTPTPAIRSFTVLAVTPPVPFVSSEAPPTTVADRDRDTILDASDNCVENPNKDQADKDADGIGDACDESDASVGPTLAKAVIARIKTGEVFVKLPPGRRLKQTLPGSAGAQPGFVPLKGAVVLPVGSVVDAEQGRLSITSASGAKKRAKVPTQRADFYDGTFQVRQARAKKPITELRLRSANFSRDCGASRSSRAGGAAAAQSSSKKVVARLWGNGKGRFRSRGRNSTATVRGTIWLTEERCDGTLTRVDKGVVVVRNLRGNRNVTVRAGRSYLARARGIAANKRPG